MVFYCPKYQCATNQGRACLLAIIYTIESIYWSMLSSSLLFTVIAFLRELFTDSQNWNDMSCKALLRVRQLGLIVLLYRKQFSLLLPLLPLNWIQFLAQRHPKTLFSSISCRYDPFSWVAGLFDLFICQAEGPTSPLFFIDWLFSEFSCPVWNLGILDDFGFIKVLYSGCHSAQFGPAWSRSYLAPQLQDFSKRMCHTY